MKIRYLSLTENKFGTMKYGNFTVKPGNFFGVAVIEEKAYRVFWSGWTSNHEIALYFVGNEAPLDASGNPHIWVGEEEVEHYWIEKDRDFWQEYLDLVEENRYDVYRADTYERMVPWFDLPEYTRSEESEE